MTTTTTAMALLWLLFFRFALGYATICLLQASGSVGGAMDSFAARCNARNALSRWAMATATLTTDYSHTPLERQQTSRGIERRPIEGV